MKTPRDCESLQDIRAEIDGIDHEIITALGRRFAYVKAAAAFKTSETSVHAPERVASMVEQRRRWAEQEGLNPDVIERMFRDLVAYFTAAELSHYQDAGNGNRS